jgi:hypothetical protein
LYIGSGTGFAVEELHIVEIAEEEVLSNKDYFVPNPQYFKDHYYQPKAYVDKLVESVTLKSYHKQNELMLDIGINGEITTINLRSLQSIKKEIAIDDMACFGDIVVFNFNNGKLTAQFVMGVTSEAFAAPYPIGEVYADVNYSQNRFVLSNLHFKQDEGI